MDRIFGRAEIGRKNIVLGIALFLVFGVGIGIPLTINMFGGSVLSGEAYVTWKVIHGYAVFLSLINYLFGLIIDRWHLTRQQKEIASWSIVLAGLIGAVGRMTLVLLGSLEAFGMVASLGETVFMALGIGLVVLGQARGAASDSTS